MYMAHSTSGRVGYVSEEVVGGNPRRRMAHMTSGRQGFEGSTIAMPMAHVSSGRDGFRPAPSRTGHVGVQCDICGARDFSGVRYKCSTCADYDVCSNCIDEVENRDLHPHTFLRVAKPIRMMYAHEVGAVPLLANRSEWVHRGVCCHNCAESEKDKQVNCITGYRYFCTICGVSLCEYCEQTSGHDASHALLKMTPPPAMSRSASSRK
mmetsp:Transcript_38015/g.70813  ORF Transcript_38015/g.70813 Transcript_38015/m.70813 type:complete len:208 (-) Transcript_38015:183-806(-)